MSLETISLQSLRTEYLLQIYYSLKKYFIFRAGNQPNNEESEEEIRARLNRLRGVDEKPEGASSQQNILITKPDQPAVIQADHLLKQIGEQVVIERDIPNPDEELEERLAKLKGVEVGQIRHPGKGLDSDPGGSAHEDSLLLHDHSSYTIIHSTVDDQDEAELAKDITNINKEVSFFFDILIRMQKLTKSLATNEKFVTFALRARPYMTSVDFGPF